MDLLFHEHTIFSCTLIPYKSKVWTFLSHHFPGFCILCLCLLLIIDRTLHISFLCFDTSVTFYGRHLQVWHTSITIWNKNKVVVGLTATVWAANVVIFIQGEALSTCPSDKLKLGLPVGETDMLLHHDNCR